MNYYIKVLKNYAVFSGRAQRKEFWMFALFNGIIIIILAIISSVINSDILSMLYSLFVLIPSLAVSVRRLHDINKSGWWFLIVFVPIIGLYYLLLVVRDSQAGANQYGPNPKEAKTAQIAKNNK